LEFPTGVGALFASWWNGAPADLGWAVLPVISTGVSIEEVARSCGLWNHFFEVGQALKLSRALPRLFIALNGSDGYSKLAELDGQMDLDRAGAALAEMRREMPKDSERIQDYWTCPLTPGADAAGPKSSEVSGNAVPQQFRRRQDQQSVASAIELTLVQPTVKAPAQPLRRQGRLATIRNLDNCLPED
jgi:hypothetical protein